VGFLSEWRTLTSVASALQDPSNVGIRSPWSTGTLAPVILPDLASIFGVDEFEWATREEALSIPAVYRARAILLALIPDKPLSAYRGAERLPYVDARWLQRTPGILGPWQRMARTVDDLIFYPYSLWLTKRGVRDGDGRRPILDAVHCPYGSWRINEADQIELANRDGGWDIADEDEVLLIPGPSEGLLRYASRTLRGSADLERSWVDRARNPSPITELHLTDDTQLDDAEVAETRDGWVKARRARNGAVAVTPSNVEVIDHGTADSALFIEGRNTSRMDIASFFNMPGAILDATTAQASLTYVTQEGTRTSLYDLTLPYWYRPIEARLSQDDVVPSGQSVRFDFSSLAPTAPAITTED
jgi:hypothetical protein